MVRDVGARIVCDRRRREDRTNGRQLRERNRFCSMTNMGMGRLRRHRTWSEFRRTGSGSRSDCRQYCRKEETKNDKHIVSKIFQLNVVMLMLGEEIVSKPVWQYSSTLVIVWKIATQYFQAMLATETESQGRDI